MLIQGLTALLLASGGRAESASTETVRGTEPVVITASRWPQRARETTRQVVSLNEETLARRAPRTAADAFREEPGVLVQETFPGHAAIWSRGQIGRSNLVLIDGVRLNNAATENLQSLNLVDPESLERLELMRGPGSVLYGPDALGGVVYAVPRRRLDYSRPFAVGGRLAGTYRSAYDGTTGRLEAEGNKGDFGLLAGGTFKKLGDLDPGRGLPIASPSGYTGRDADVALDWRGAPVALRATYQHAEQSDVPRYNQYVNAHRYATAGTFLEHVIDPEVRDLAIVESIFEPGRAVTSLSVKGWWQRQESRARQIAAAAPTTEQLRRNVTATLGARVETISDPAPWWRLIYGLDIYQDKVTSTRSDKNTVSGALTPNDANADFPDGSKFGNAGLFVLNRFKPAERWVVEVGARGNKNWTDSVLRGNGALTVFNNDPYYDQSYSLTGGAGAGYQATSAIQLTAGVWQGFRPPNLTETVALRTSNASGADVPVSGLRPERSIGFELGLRERHERVRQTFSVYHILLRDNIDRVPGTFLGRNFIDLNNNGTKQANEPFTFVKANSSVGYVQGFEWEGELFLVDDVSVFGNASYAYGRDTAARTALARMPPFMGLAGLRWAGEGPRQGWAEVFARGADRQRRLGPSDLTDSSINPAGTASWITFNARAGLRPTANTRASIGVENIFDMAYREHASGIDAPGIDAVLRLELFFR